MPAYRHRAPNMLEVGFHMPMVAENGVGHGGENGDFKFPEPKVEQVNVGEGVEGENGDVHSQESIEERVNGRNLDCGDIDVPVDVEIGDAEFHVSEEEMTNGWNLEREAVMPEKMNKDQILQGDLYVSEKIDGVVDAEVNVGCRGEEVVAVEGKREDLNGDGRESEVESNDTEADRLTTDEGVEDRAETDQGVQEALNGLVRLDGLPNGQGASVGHSKTGTGNNAKSYASAVEQGLPEEPEKKTVGEGSSSVSMAEIMEKCDRESILVEDLGESSLINNDDNGSLSQAVMPSASCIGNSAGPPPSVGLGSSSGSMLEIMEECDRESVLVEAIGESSSTDNDNNGNSSQGAKPSVSYIRNSAGPSLPSCPAGLGSASPLLEPAARSVQQPRVNGVHQQRPQPREGPVNDDPEENENDETRRKLQDIRVKFLRLARRLGQTPHNVVVAQVLYRLGLAEQLKRNTNRVGVFSFDQASVMAEQLEAAGKDLDDFTCTILMIGKAGVGKSATINSILDEHEGTMRVYTDAFQSGTKTVQVIKGRVQRINVRVIDTPGLFTCSMDQQHNVKILNSIKKVIRKTPPDIVLYFDRLDMQNRNFGDVPLLRSITDIFGTSIWFNAIVVLSHAASAPPDGPNGIPLSYEMFVTQRSHVVQQAIRQAAGDVRLMNPVSLVENHSACRMNRNGQRVLPNGQVWKPQLLLLSFASKVLAEANMLLKLQDSPPNIRRARLPPLPAFLSSLLQSRPQLKLPEEQYSDDDAAIDDLDQTSGSDEGGDYDELPPFEPLNKAQMAKLTKEQKKAYFEELEYREKLFSKKQLKEERKHRKLMRNMAEAAKDLPNDYNGENLEDESSSPASVPVALPDLVLPTSFDSDNPTHRYRFLETSNQWVVRPVLETQGWDHDIGYEGLNLERLFVVKDKVPVSVSGQLTKDKEECTIQMEFASSIKHSETGATSLGLDVLTVGKDLAYTLRCETRVKNFRRNNTAAGVSVTLLGDAMSAGVKIEDKLVVTKRLRLLMSGGAVTGRGDIAYGGHLEATLRDKDYPIGRTLSTLALSVVDWHGDLATGCNIQSQFPFGRGTNVIGHANLSNRGTGQVGIRLNSSEHMQIALLALFPIFKSLKRFLVDSSQPM